MADGKRRYKSDRKDHKVSVKLSEKDMDILKAALNRTGMTASAYIRELIRTGGNIDTTGRSLYPIGSSCIEKFERDDLDYEVDVQMDMYRLAHAMERGERIELTSKYFSKNLLYALYEEGAFAPNKYNRYDGTNDYQFMLDMFNKRNKSEITEQQHRKIRGLIAYSIKPFLRERLKYK